MREARPTTPYIPRSLRTVWKKAFPLAQEMHKDNKEAMDIFMKFARGSSANMHARLQAEREFANTQAVARARRQRQKGNRKVVQNGGVIYAANARSIVQKREQEALKAARALLRKERATAKQLLQDATRRPES